MPINQRLVERWMNDEDVDLADFGGAAAFLDDIAALITDDPLTVAEVICAYWDEFARFSDRAIQALTAAADADDVEMDAVHDVLLQTPAVLAAAAEPLRETLAARATTSGLLGDIATETWTRLALGGWCSSYAIRGHLQERVTSVGADATIHLVRSVAAAVSGWDDVELLPAMHALGELEEFEGDVQFELAMRELGAAAASKDMDTAMRHLRTSLEHLHASERVDGRLDARAYLGPLQALLAFTEGTPVAHADVVNARSTINEYLLGYRGLRRHWRQGYADACDGWATLLGLLAAAQDAGDENWFRPSDVIQAAASLYAAETSISLISRDGTAPAAQSGIATLVRPAIVQSFVAHKPATQFLDTWLQEVAPDSTEALVAAVRQLRDDVHLTHLPKADGGSTAHGPADKPETDDSWVDLLKSAVGQAPLEFHTMHLVRRIIDDINRLVPDHARSVLPELTSLVAHLVRFTAWMLNQPQRGQQRFPLYGLTLTEEGDPQLERRFADAIYGWLVAAGLDASVEQLHAGGRADVVVRFPGSRFFIEAKRIKEPESDTEAFAHYGEQAVQYATSSTPIAFLAIIDYSRRETRLDLQSVFWTDHQRLPDVPTAFALTGLRVQANVASPSSATKNYRKTNKTSE